MKDNPLVSVIIPTYNSEKTIQLCIESIINQTYDNIEIIIVDNNSSDKTKKIAAGYNLKFIIIESPRSKARNIGIRSSQGFFLLCIDSDMELTKNVIEKCVKTFRENKNIGGVIIPERSIGESFWVKVRDFERSFYNKTDIESARFFQTEIVNKVGGYDDEIVFFEESALPHKIKLLGYNVTARIDSFIFHHEHEFNIIQWLKKKYYYAKTLKLYSNRYQDYASRQTSVFYRFIIFFKNRRFYLYPKLAFGILILKTLEFSISAVGYIAGRLVTYE